MKKVCITLLMLILSSVTNAKEQVIEDGFKAFKEKGAIEAWNIWAKNGPMEGSKELNAQASQFGQIGAYYGNYHSHDYVAEKELSPTTKFVYIVLNMDSGPLFGRFYLYKKASGVWTVPNFNFHTLTEQIWPSNLYSSCEK